MSTLERQRIAAEARLALAEKRAGESYLDAETYDASTIIAAEADLVAIRAAEGELARRERAATVAAEAARVAAARERLIETEAKRLDAVEWAETAARNLSAALIEVMAHGRDVTRLVRSLGGGSCLPLDSYDHAMRLSCRLSSAMTPLCGVTRRFGQVAFGTDRPPFDQPWRAAEEAIGRNEVTKATKDAAS